MDHAKHLARSTAALVLFALVGKIMGFGRESLIAYHFGTGMEKAAWTVAQSSTGLMSALITEAIATTFIPQLQKLELQEGVGAKNRYTSNMLFLTMAIAAVMASLGIGLAPAIAELTGGGLKPETFALTVRLIRLSMPLIIFAAAVGVLTGFNQSHNFFIRAGAVNVPLNLVYILYLVLFAKHLGIYGVAFSAVLGVVAQMLFLIPDARRAGFRLVPTFNPRDTYAKEAIFLALPVLVSVSVNNVNTIVNRYLASSIGNAAVSRLDYANKLNLLIIGIFIAAITAVIFPPMSRAFAEKNTLFGKQIMNGAVKTVLLITVPSTIGMIVLARPIVELAFQRGAFHAEDTLITAEVLRCYAFVLIGLSLNNVLNRVFYSLQDTKTPFTIGLINVGINVTLNFLVVGIFGIRGLAASVSFSTTVACLLRFFMLHKKLGRLGLASYMRALVKTLIAGLAMGAFVYVSFFPLEALLAAHLAGHLLVLGKLALLLLVVACAAFLYGAILYLLGMREVRDLIAYVESRRQRQ